MKAFRFHMIFIDFPSLNGSVQGFLAPAMLEKRNFLRRNDLRGPKPQRDGFGIGSSQQGYILFRTPSARQLELLRRSNDPVSSAARSSS